MSKEIVTLSEFCLKNIADNMDYVVFAYNQLKSAFCQKPFEFLQRKFSSYLLSRLLLLEKMKLNYLNFLVNCHLEELDLSSAVFDLDDPISIIERLTEIGKNIISINMSKKKWAENDLITVISLLPNVKVLNMSYTSSSDQVMQAVALQCPSVDTLNLEGCVDITNTGLEFFATGHEHRKNCILQHLYLRRTHITGRGLEYALEHFPMLNSLDHEALGAALCNLSNNMFNGPYNLTYLKISEHVASAQPKLRLGPLLRKCGLVCPSVTSIVIENVKDDTLMDVNTCMSFSNLEHIEIITGDHFYNVTVNCSNFLMFNGANLRSLKLTEGNVPLGLISEHCPRLETLVLDSCVVSDSDDLKLNMDFFKPLFPHVKMLGLNSLDFTNRNDFVYSTLVISSSPRVEVLHLRNCIHLTSALVKYLTESACFANLDTLELDGTLVNAPCLETILERAVRLKTVTIGYNSGITTEEHREMRSKYYYTDIIWRPEEVPLTETAVCPEALRIVLGPLFTTGPVGALNSSTRL